MAPTNVKEFYEEMLDGLDVAAAETAFSDAQEAERTAADDATAALEALAGIEDDIAATRTAIEAAQMPAEVAALADDLRALMIDRRHQRAELLVEEDEAHAKQYALAVAQSELERVRSESAATEAIVTEETERRTRLDAWKLDAVAAPLSDLAADANALLTETLTVQEETDLGDPAKAGAVAELKPFAAAAARLAGDFPAELLARGQERIAYEVSRRARRASLLDNALDEDAERRESVGGPEAKVANKRADFEAAEAVLGAFVNGAAERLDQTKLLLRMIVTSPSLDADVAARINDAAVADPGKVGATAEKTYQDAVEDLEAKTATRDQKTLELVAADVDLLDAADLTAALIAADPAWEPLNNEVTDAEAALPGEPSADDKANLDSWEVAVPDNAWANLVQLEEAQRMLTEIKDTVPGDVVTALDNAEAALLTALLEWEKSVRTETYLADESGSLGDDSAHFSATFGQRVAGAARGDA